MDNLKISMNGYRLEVEFLNTAISFVNALRRILLSDIPTVVTNNVVVLENTSSMTHEMLQHRMEMIPINVQPDEVATIRDTVIELKATAPDDSTKEITTDDFTVTGPRPNVVLLDRDLNTPLYFMTLKPGESVHIKATLGIETKKVSQVSVATFSNHIDEKQRQLDRATWIAENNDPAVFDNLHYQRSYARDEQGRPYHFDFVVESIGITKAKDLLIRAAEILRTRFIEFAELPIQKGEGNWYSMEMDGDPHTVGQLAQQIIYGTHLTDFVSRDAGHPLVPKLVIRFNTKVKPEDVIARMRAEGETLCKFLIKYIEEN